MPSFFHPFCQKPLSNIPAQRLKCGTQMSVFKRGFALPIEWLGAVSDFRVKFFFFKSASNFACAFQFSSKRFPRQRKNKQRGKTQENNSGFEPNQIQDLNFF